MSRALARVPLAEQWADRICTQLGKSVESIIEVGRLLIKAKADLAHGEWGRLFEERLLPFSPNTAQRLMAIAANPQLSNTAHAPLLPPSWTSLYELTKLPEPTLKHALADGLITPDMPRKAVTALLPPRPPAKPRVVAPLGAPATASADDFAMPRWADDEIRERVHAALAPVRALIEDWPDGQSFALLIHELQQVSRYLERIAQ